jgi:glycosyltransferase involved in cell wall biosynthesis
MRLLGIIHGYNEGDCLENSIKCLLDSGHSVHVFDHGSTDNTKEIITSFKERVTYEYLDRNKIHFWKGPNNLFNTISRFINSKQPLYDWVTWLDADEILVHKSNTNLQEELLHSFNSGIKVIQTEIKEYWVTEKDDPSIVNCVDRQKYFLRRSPGSWGGINRSWLLSLTGNMGRGKHRNQSQWGRNVKIDGVSYVINHYPIRSEEHGKRKILVERNWKNKGHGCHYDSYLNNNCSHIIKESNSLEKD